MPSVTLTCTQDTSVVDSGGGSGNGLVLPVGLYGGNIYRALLKFALPDWSQWTKITKAVLVLTNSSQVVVNRGSTPRIFVARLTGPWSEGSFVAYSTSNATDWANQPAATSTQIDSTNLATGDGTKVSIDVTQFVLDWAPTRIPGGKGGSNFGLRLAPFDDTATSRTTEFRSRETTSDPQLVITYEANNAPGAPTALTPGTADDGSAAILGTTATSATTRAATFRGTAADPDAGDYITRVELEVYADAATDTQAAARTVTPVMKGTFALSGTPTSFALYVDTTPLAIGTTYRWRARTADKLDTWGPWSSLADGRIIADTLPGAPSNLAVDVDTLTPNFYGSLVDADSGATLGAVRIVVYQDTTAGAVQKWDSDWQTVGGTRFVLAYGGTPLDFGTKYRFAAQVRDNLGGAGPLSSYLSWTPVSTVGPSNMTPRDIETKQNSLTPTLTIGHATGFTNHELQVARFPDPSDASERLWYPAVGTAYGSTTTKPVTYAGAALAWGRTYYWRARVLVGGATWTEFSPWYPFYLNAAPTAPAVSVDGTVKSVASDGSPLYVGTTLTPVIRAAFADPDLGKGYADPPARREIAIQRADTLAHVTGSPFVITTGISATYTVGAGLLTRDVTYKVSVRYDDSANVRSPYGVAYLKPSNAPTIALTAPADNALTGDPTPALDWAYSSASSKPQRRFRVRVYGDGS